MPVGLMDGQRTVYLCRQKTLKIVQQIISYHCDMDSALFETWFKNQLLPNIPPRSVIVMDNASYHSKQINKKPTSTTRKQDILDYMQSNKIPVPQGKNTKLALLNIIKELNISAEYRVDNLAKANNHDVLRLPPYYCVLNPIELVWVH
jgi:transposase